MAEHLCCKTGMSFAGSQTPSASMINLFTLTRSTKFTDCNSKNRKKYSILKKITKK
jgi:hypothetical protein